MAYPTTNRNPPQKMVQIIRFFHDGMKAGFVNGKEEDDFHVSNGVKKGYVLAATLFSFLFSTMMLSAFKKTDPGIQISYQTNGGVFNMHRLRAKTKVTLGLIRELLYANDCAIVMHSVHDLQQLADSLSIGTKRFGLTISIKKTEVLFQPARGSTASTPKIKIDGKILNSVDSFTYPGSNLSSSNSLDKEISTRIANTSASHGRLQKRVWCDRGLNIETECAVYKAVVLSALLYGFESWTLYRRHIKLLDQFHQRCLQRLMNINWFNKVTNVKVLQEAKTESIDTLLTLSQLR